MTASAEEGAAGRSSPPAKAVVLWLLVGAAAGVGGAVFAQVAPWPLSALPHYAAPSVLLLVLIGAAAATRRAAAVLAASCFLAFVLGYYAVVVARFGAVPVLYAGAWLVAAVTVCPVAAAAVRWARSRTGLLPAGVSAAAGAVAVADGAVGQLVRVAADRGVGASVDPALAAADLLVVAAVLAVVPRDARTRWMALGLLVPFGLVATFAGWAAHFGPGPYL